MDAEDIKPEHVAKAFGEVLRLYRRERGLSQERLAEMCDLDRSYMSMLERSIYQSSLTVFLKLAHALNVSAAEMIEAVREKCEVQASEK